MKDAEMIPCDQVIARLWEYIDGELTGEHAARIRAHLDICGRCFPQYDFQRVYKTFIRHSYDQPMSPGLRRRVFEAILAEDQGQPWPNGGPEEADAGILIRLRATLHRLLGRKIDKPRS